MKDIQIDMYGFLGVLEVAFALLIVALVFIVRSKRLADRVQVLQRKLKKSQAQQPVEVAAGVESISFAQYLRDEVTSNQQLIELAAASDDDAEKKAAKLLQLRNQFLELEVEVRSLEDSPEQFQDRLAAGMSDLVEQLRPQPEAVTQPEETANQVEIDPEPDIEPGTADERVTVDTHEAEFNRLKAVINNQQDAMAALRQELEARESDIKDAGPVMRKLDEFEQQSAELQQSLTAQEEENERRLELEQIQKQLEQHEPKQDAPLSGVEPDIMLDDSAGVEPEAADTDAQTEVLETRVQELEALLEFKDATIEELEKQYHTLETRYLAATGEEVTS